MNALRAASAAVFAAASLMLSSPAAADQPTRIDFTFDLTIPSETLTELCGVPVYIHQSGSGTSTLFSDRSGDLVRELDTLAAGLTTTVFSPIEEGGTGESFTEVTHQPSTFAYPEGTDLGAPVIISLFGVQRTSGPGGPRIVGRQVLEGVIIGYTDDGVPIADVVGVLSMSGQFDIDAVLAERCDLLTP